jgi:hypothetical protein
MTVTSFTNQEVDTRVVGYLPTYHNNAVNMTAHRVYLLRQLNKKQTNALIIQCIGTQYFPTCFGTLKMP